jgi:hypothetical protein
MITNKLTKTPKAFYSVPPVDPAAPITAQPRLIDAETKHRIYDRLLTILSNPQIKVKKTGAVLSFVLHLKTKDTLMSEHGYTVQEIAELEAQIINDADENLNAYEVVRDVPSALYHGLQKVGEEDLIFHNRMVSLPDPALNALVCESLQKEFARKTLLACDGFIEHRGADENGVIHRSVRLNVGGWIVRHGFMMPVYRYGLITALRVFRHPQDERPFRLKSRTRRKYS